MVHSESLSKISGPASTQDASSTILFHRGICIDRNLRHLCADKVGAEEDSLVPICCQPREPLYAGDVTHLILAF